MDIIKASWKILSDNDIPLAIYIAGEGEYNACVYDSYHDYLIDNINHARMYDSTLDMYETLATLANVPFHRFESRGYSQGDYSEWIIFITEKYIKTTGINPEDADAIFKETKKLYYELNERYIQEREFFEREPE